MTTPINLNVTNGPVSVGSICILGVSSSSSLLIGDTESLTLYSYFDTPPESVIVGNLAPLPLLEEEESEEQSPT
ncbi:spore gernimation protein GerPD [Cohnella lupini]|jgi:spore germination protein PD|uniref:Spore germination protein PD n=1 Tax=Cohnella lupini TaxID=1294267 RepID=A0A3D9IIY0_9BACL|nr:spore gernimation protein GerPD [Cohnella lupini]RED61692.1 spore germination protein PD [Cohnella lupini]